MVIIKRIRINCLKPRIRGKCYVTELLTIVESLSLDRGDAAWYGYAVQATLCKGTATYLLQSFVQHNAAQLPDLGEGLLLNLLNREGEDELFAVVAVQSSHAAVVNDY